MLSIWSRSKFCHFGKELTHLAALPFPKQALIFTCLQYKFFENTVRKGEIARKEQLLLFPQYFLPVWITFSHSRQI